MSLVMSDQMQHTGMVENRDCSDFPTSPPATSPSPQVHSRKDPAPPIARSSPRKRPSNATTTDEICLPAVIFQRDRSFRPKDFVETYLLHDLKPARLNSVHRHLWLAGLPTAARPLHRQRLLGRTLLITENPDEHLVWFETQMFLKPLPLYLLEADYWHKHLCANHDVFEAAQGMLLSYAWLVCHESDMNIAQEIGLLPRDITWPAWVSFMEVFLDNLDLSSLFKVNKRYHYGELRLTRLNHIYRFLPPEYTLRNLVRGYKDGSTWYAAYFSRHFRCLLAIFAIFSVALSALQVGLATSFFQGNRRFENASYGFAVVVLVMIVWCVISVFLIWFALFWYHLVSTWQLDRRVRLARGADNHHVLS